MKITKLENGSIFEFSVGDASLSTGTGVHCYARGIYKFLTNAKRRHLRAIAFSLACIKQADEEINAFKITFKK